MLNWNYTPPSYNITPIGNYRARIHDIAWDVSKSGRTMLVVTCKISGQKSKLKYYLVFNPDTPETVNRSNFYFKKFCDAFSLNPADINNQNFNLNQWLNAEGGVNIIHEERNGVVFPSIKSFLSRKQLDFLVPFIDADAPQQQQQLQPQQQQQQLQPQRQFQNFGQPAMDSNGIITF